MGFNSCTKCGNLLQEISSQQEIKIGEILYSAPITEHKCNFCDKNLIFTFSWNFETWEKEISNQIVNGKEIITSEHYKFVRKSYGMPKEISRWLVKNRRCDGLI